MGKCPWLLLTRTIGIYVKEKDVLYINVSMIQTMPLNAWNCGSADNAIREINIVFHMMFYNV